jgi:hypothetical protein
MARIHPGLLRIGPGRQGLRPPGALARHIGYLLAPVDTERWHIIIVEGLLLVITEYDQHVGRAALQGLSNPGNTLLVGRVPLLEDVRRQLLRNSGVDFSQQLLIGDMLAIGYAIQGLVALVFLAPLQPVLRGEAQLRAM